MGLAVPGTNPGKAGSGQGVGHATAPGPRVWSTQGFWPELLPLDQAKLTPQPSGPSGSVPCGQGAPGGSECAPQPELAPRLCTDEEARVWSGTQSQDRTSCSPGLMCFLFSPGSGTIRSVPVFLSFLPLRPQSGPSCSPACTLTPPTTLIPGLVQRGGWSK